METVPTQAQLIRGAEGICYRAQQLAYAVMLGGYRFPSVPKGIVTVIANSRIESVLTNARALTDFLAPKPRRKKYLHHSHYKPWTSDVMTQTGRIFGVLSAHLSHPTLGGEEEETHPGAWPLSELAVTLLDGLGEFLVADPGMTPTFKPSWFVPSPVHIYGELMQALERVPPTEISEHPQVGKLTTALQTYLKGKGLIIPHA